MTMKFLFLKSVFLE